MNHEDFCSLELSKKLKEKGYNWFCQSYYDTRNPSEIQFQTKAQNLNCKSFHISASTLYQAQKWLREVHHLSVEVYSSFDANSNWVWDSFVKNLDNYMSDNESEYTSINHQTYEQALSAGITKALELI